MSTDGDSLIKRTMSDQAQSINDKKNVDNHQLDSSQNSKDSSTGSQQQQQTDKSADTTATNKNTDAPGCGDDVDDKDKNIIETIIDKVKEKNESTEDVDNGGKSENEEENEKSIKKNDDKINEDNKLDEKNKVNDKEVKDEKEIKTDKKESVETAEDEKDTKEAKDEKRGKTNTKTTTKATKNDEEDVDDEEVEEDEEDNKTDGEENEEEEEEVEEEEEDDEEDDDDSRNKNKKKKSAEATTKKQYRKKDVKKNDQTLRSNNKDSSKSSEFEEDGCGVALGEIPRIEASITRFKNDDLKLLHKLLFDGDGKAAVLKKNIKKFNGFTFKKDSNEYEKKIDSCKKLEVKSLKSICEMLDLDKKGSKDEIVEKVMKFLMNPKDSGKAAGGGRPKRASAVRANNRGYSSHDDYSSDERQTSRARRDKGKRANLKDESSSDEEFKPDDVSDASDEKPRTINKRKRGRTKRGGDSSDEDEASLTEASSDYSEEEPRAKRRKSVTKVNNKAKPKTATRGRGRPPKSATSATRKRGRKPRDVSSDEENFDEGSSSEDEPLAKKKPRSAEPPTDDEIRVFIRSILDGANLEEITMKTVCQRVYDNYPKFDLTSRKKFIKSTVKSLIST